MTLIKDQLLERVKSRLRRAGLDSPEQRAVMAVSGGADSMALLALVASVPPAMRARFSVLHVQHGLRGKESAADEALVRKACIRWDFPLSVRQAKVAKGSGVEEKARTARLKAYAAECGRRRASWLLLAHHQIDRAETVLMNLARGAGLKGAGALPERAPLPGRPDLTLLRLLIEEDPAELRRWLKARRIAWREDKSNRDQRLARNHVRHTILPALDHAWPGASVRLAAFASKANLSSAWITAQATQALQLRQGRKPGLDLRAFGRDPFLDDQVLRAWLQQAGLSPEDRMISRLEDLMSKEKGQCDLKRGWRAKIKGGRLHLQRPGKTL